MDDFENEDAFKKDRRIQKCLRLIRMLKTTNAMAFRKINNHLMDREPIESTFDGKFTKVLLPSSELFEKCYGPIVITFIGNNTEIRNLCNVEPRKYLEACCLSEPVSYHGLMVPNKKIYKDKVDFILKLLK